MSSPSVDQLLIENELLHRQLEEAVATINALRAGEVDAVVVGTEHEQIYTLESADRPYRLMVEQIPQGAAALDENGVIVHCNPRFTALLNRPLENLAGKPFRDFVIAEQQPTVDALLRGALDSDVQEEFAILLPDDTTVQVYLGASAHKEGAFGLVLLVTDLTEQRQYHLLQRTQAALRASERALRDADRRKDEFLATLAHELRNPLAPMRNAVQILRALGPDHPELNWGRDVLDRQVAHMARLLEDLFDVSRISRNTLELRKEIVELSDVLRSALETSQPMIEAKGHKVTVALLDEPILVDADAMRLAQVFSNLLNNSAKYSDTGGEIILSVAREGDGVAVSVKDCGIGIPADALPAIFDLFTQAKPASMESQGGLGVGLSLVKRLVELHDGTVEAKSDGPGCGSEFIIRIPVATGAFVAQSEDQPGAASSELAMNLRILVVDDNADSADSLAMLLQLMGNHVNTANDGEAAVEMVEPLRPDLVLLDIGMPKLNGYEACRLIREKTTGQDIVLIALTGWGQEEDLRRTQEAGFDAHMVKPVDPVELTKVVAALLKAREAKARSRAPRRMLRTRHSNFEEISPSGS